LNKKRFALIIAFILCLFSCCGRQNKIDIPTEVKSQGSQILNHIIKINVDDEFTADEEITVEQALKVWEKVSGNYIKFEYIYHQKKPGRLEDYFWKKQYGHSVFIWKATSYSISTAFDYKYINYVGFWDIHGNIVVFTDRMDQNNQLYNVLVHEIGHMLGLKHVEYEKSVMQPNAINISDCITKDDADRLCLIYGCEPKPECD
jgi:hypothetical protein